MQMRQQCRQLIARFKCGNAIELRLERRKALAIDGGRVHAGGVFIADLLLVGSARIGVGVGRGRFFQNQLRVQPVEFMQLREAAIGGLVGGQRVAFEPAIATEAVKVLAGVDALVHKRGIEDP